jgi:hypothetical protein
MTETAASIAAVLLVVVAAVQVGLAVGAPFGHISWGGRHHGRLPDKLRVGSGVAAVILLLAALIVLAKGGLVGWSPIPESWLTAATWALAGFLALNTLGNLSSESRIESIVFAPTTAILVVLLVVVAFTGDGPA